MLCTDRRCIDPEWPMAGAPNDLALCRDPERDTLPPLPPPQLLLRCPAPNEPVRRRSGGGCDGPPAAAAAAAAAADDVPLSDNGSGSDTWLNDIRAGGGDNSPCPPPDPAAPAAADVPLSEASSGSDTQLGDIRSAATVVGAAAADEASSEPRDSGPVLPAVAAAPKPPGRAKRDAWPGPSARAGGAADVAVGELTAAAAAAACTDAPCGMPTAPAEATNAAHSLPAAAPAAPPAAAAAPAAPVMAVSASAAPRSSRQAARDTRTLDASLLFA